MSFKTRSDTPQWTRKMSGRLCTPLQASRKRIYANRRVAIGHFLFNGTPSVRQTGTGGPQRTALRLGQGQKSLLRGTEPRKTASYQPRGLSQIPGPDSPFMFDATSGAITVSVATATTTVNDILRAHQDLIATRHLLKRVEVTMSRHSAWHGQRTIVAWSHHKERGNNTKDEALLVSYCLKTGIAWATKPANCIC